MGRFARRTLAAIVLALLAAPIARAQQQAPSPAEAQQMLAEHPELVGELQQRIIQSGMTPEQIRARLKAEGYPEHLLDAYLGAGPLPDSLSGSAVSAARELGIVDSLDALNLLARRLPGPVAVPHRDLVATPYTPDGSVIFGLDVFERGSSQFEPDLAGPVDENYKLGPGDRLVLLLSGDVELARTLDVTREGFVVIPQVGTVEVANLTIGQLEDVLLPRLQKVYSGIGRGPNASTRFSISVSRLRTNQVFVVGDVFTPGSYRISSAGTALTALYAAGGPTANGSMRDIQIRRAGSTVSVLDVYDYLLRGDASHDVRLNSGDVVFVPVHGPQVRVTGEVMRPATYELKAGESLPDLLRAAGGFTATAARRRVQIERIVAPTDRGEGGRDRTVIDISSDQFANGFGPAEALQAGDIVHVFTVNEEVRDRITVNGNVWAPGVQGFKSGMTLSDAIRQAGGVKPDVFLGELLVTRYRTDSTAVQLRSAFRDSLGNVTNDIPLQQDDEITVFSTRSFRPDRYVAIAGAVRSPGRFPYRDGMTVRDLVLLAGGVLESAYLREGEIARLPDSRANGVTATTIRFPLDSTYLFERTADQHYNGPPGIAASDSTAPDVPLKPYDNVLILEQPDWALQRTVVVSGEVRFPGRYALRSKSERLSDVIARAGGLTNEAYAEGVYFNRSFHNLGRIGVDLPHVLKDHKSRDNLILLDGDSVYVPAYQAVVNVTGAVNSPVAVAYVPGASLEYYIGAAGGEARNGDVSHAYVQQPNGKVEAVTQRAFFPDSHPQPLAGSTIVVPTKEPSNRTEYLAFASVATQVLASLVAIIVVLKK